MNKKQLKLFIGAIIYISLLGFLVPFIVFSLDLFQVIYDFIGRLVPTGAFFILFLLANFIFPPFIYSTFFDEKISYESRLIFRKNAIYCRE